MKLTKHLKVSEYSYPQLGIVVLMVGVIGAFLLVSSRAASPYANSEAENGTLSAASTGISKITDANASAGSYVQFGTVPSGGGGGGGGSTGLIKGVDSRNWPNNAQLGQIGQRLGAKYIRYDGPPDSQFTFYKQYGLTMLPIINYDTSYFTRHPETPIYELDNEPYWGGRSTPATVAQRYKSAAQQLPAGKILLLPYDEYSDWRGDVLGQMLSAVPDLANYITGVAIHPYSTVNDPSNYSQNSGGWAFNRIDAWHQHFTDRGINVPWYITEVGWTDTDFGSTVGNPTIATYYTHLGSEIAKRSWITGVFQYQLTDQHTGDFSNREYTFGVYTDQYQPKPAATALANWYGGSP